MFEYAIRPSALGRKNYLFFGNYNVAENAAILYSGGNEHHYIRI
ncbi:MAG: hypothetical protein GX293_01355 [Bacteroidales bacterium]|nr:hypothetical protein [Bacteroidales bacterium]